MRDRLSIILRVASSALVIAGYMALSSVYQYGAGFMLIPLLLLPLAPIGEWLERYFGAWRILRRIAVISYFCFLPFSLSMLGLMDAVVALIIFIQAYLLLGEKNERVWYETYLMSFFLLLAAVVQSPEPLIAIALLLFGISAVWAFTALRMKTEIDRSPGRAFPEIRPLHAGVATIRTGNLVDFGLVATLSLLSVLSVLLTVTFFLLTPRVQAGWLGRSEPRESVTGLPDTVRLTGDTSIYEDQSVLMHVRFPDEPESRFEPASALYWRVATLSRFSNEEWSRRGLQHHYEPGVPALIGLANAFFQNMGRAEEKRQARPNARTVRQLIYMDEVPTQGVPCLDLPLGVSVPPETGRIHFSWDASHDFSLQLQMRGTRRLQYEAWSDIIAHSPEALRDAPFDYSDMHDRDFSILTYHELLPETEALVRDLTAPYPSVYDKVMAINDWLGGIDFAYSLEVPPLPPQNAIDHFIRETRIGHCELFASALVLMVRSLGIPARVVSGFRGGDYDPNDEAYLVRASMSHLWAEVLFDGLGWVKVDPSPRMDMTPNALRRAQMAWSVFTLRSKMFWFQSVIGFEGGIRLDQLRWPWQRRVRSQRPLAHSAPEDEVVEEEGDVIRDYGALLSHPVLRVSVFLAVCAGAIFGWRTWRRLRANAPYLSRDQVRIRRLYKKLLRKAGARGVICDNHTAAEILTALLERPVPHPEEAATFIACYNAIRFGGRALDKEQRQRFAALIKSL